MFIASSGFIFPHTLDAQQLVEANCRRWEDFAPPELRSLNSTRVYKHSAPPELKKLSHSHAGDRFL